MPSGGIGIPGCGSWPIAVGMSSIAWRQLGAAGRIGHLHAGIDDDRALVRDRRPDRG